MQDDIPSVWRMDNQMQFATAPVAMDLQSPQQQQQRDKKQSKAYHIVPQDDTWRRLQEPLSSANNGGAGGATSIGEDGVWRKTKSKRAMLASSRIARDKLMRVMEDLILKEAELASAYELFDYTRQRSCLEHDEIVARLAQYETLLQDAQRREAEMSSDGGVESVLKTDLERQRWDQTKAMVQTTLPELLARLEERIELNSAKIRHIQDKMEEIRSQRLTLREEIAEKEEDIALALTAD